MEVKSGSVSHHCLLSILITGLTFFLVLFFRLFVVFHTDDITSQKKADISFRASRMSFYSICKTVSDGIVISEQVGKFLGVNPAICKKLGYRKEELLQKTVTEFIALESSEIFAEHVRELYRNG